MILASLCTRFFLSRVISSILFCPVSPRPIWCNHLRQPLFIEPSVDSDCFLHIRRFCWELFRIGVAMVIMRFSLKQSEVFCLLFSHSRIENVGPPFRKGQACCFGRPSTGNRRSRPRVRRCFTDAFAPIEWTSRITQVNRFIAVGTTRNVRARRCDSFILSWPHHKICSQIIRLFRTQCSNFVQCLF